MNVLIIEDERDIAELISHNLRHEKISSQIAGTGAEGVALAKRMKPDIIVLDLMLPDIGGFEVCKKLKASTDTMHVPILILTVKNAEVDRIVGFELGADDYLTKPFSPRELVLRIKAIVARTSQETPSGDEKTLSVGALHVDPERHSVVCAGRKIHLTALEFKLLSFLLKGEGRIATRDILLDQVWGLSAELTTRTVDTHIKRLRRKLGRCGAAIETVRGIGYRFSRKGS